MKTVSQEFKDSAENPNGARYYGKILDNGTELTDDIDDFVYNSAVSDDTGISIGSVCSSSVTFSITNPTVNLNGKELEILQGIDVGEGIEYVRIGIFKVIKPTKNRDVTSYECADRMVTLMETPYFSDLSFPNTDINVLNEICSQVGINLANSANLKAHTIEAAPSGYTKREVISYMAALQGKNAIINDEGNLELIWYTLTDYVVDDDKIYYDGTSNINDEVDYTLGYIECTVSNEEGTEQDTLKSGTGTTGIKIENPFMTQEILDEIFTSIGNFSYRAGEFEFLGDFRLEAGDIVTVNTENSSYIVPIMQLTQKSDGGVITTIQAVAETESENSIDLTGPVTKQMERYYAEIVLINQAMINKLSADEADIRYLKTDQLTAIEADIETAVIGNLSAEFATVDYLEANYAQIDLANVEKATIGTVLADVGLITSATIVDGHVTGYLDGVEINANSITAGTLDAGNIEVTNLNAANITVGQINGQHIASGAIDMEKLGSDVSTWISNTETEVDKALSDAGIAYETANAAQSTANTASTNAASALSTANTANSTANSALSIANGKSTAYYQTSAPSGGTYRTNDIWFDTDDGNKMYYWNGSAWTERQFGTSAIVAGSVTTDLLAASAVTAAKIASSAITTDKLAASAVTAAKIATDAVTAGTIAASAVTTDKLAASAVTADKIASQTITADKIVSNSITANEIASATITVNELNVSNIFGDEAVLNTITASSIFSNAIATNSVVVGASSNATTALNTANAAKKTIYHTADSGQGTSGYWHLAQIKITGQYSNQPIKISVIQRGRTSSSTVWIIFTNSASTDPTLNHFAKTGSTNFYIVKSDTSTWDLYVGKSEAYDYLNVTEYEVSSYTLQRMSLTWKNETVTALPSGYSTATQTVATAEWCYNNNITYINGGNIYTGTVTANAIAAGAITTDKLAASAVTADKLSVTSLSAITANLGTVTAGIIQSANYVADSVGMQLNLANGVWDSKYFKIASDGSITSSGGTIGNWNISDTILKAISTSTVYRQSATMMDYENYTGTTSAWTGYEQIELNSSTVEFAIYSLYAASLRARQAFSINLGGIYSTVWSGDSSSATYTQERILGFSQDGISITRLSADRIDAAYIYTPNLYIYAQINNVKGAHSVKDLIDSIYSNFSNYLPLSGGTVTGTLVLSKTTDASGTASTSPALMIGDTTGNHIAIDGNEIVAKSSGTATGTLSLNYDGGRVVIGSGGLGFTTYNNTSYALSTASFICNSWVRTVGSTGWYNETYGGGWYMTDTTWIRNYNSKQVYLNALLRVDANVQFGSSGSYYVNSSGAGVFSTVTTPTVSYAGNLSIGVNSSTTMVLLKASSYQLRFNGTELYHCTSSADASSVCNLGSSGYRFATIYATGLNVSGSIMPSANSSYSLGSSSYRWVYLYAKECNTNFIEIYYSTPYIDFHYGASTADYTARIIESSSGALKVYNSIANASDRRLKKNITDLSERYLDVLDNLKPSEFRYIKGDRYLNLGFIAQDVEEALTAAGITDKPLVSIDETNGMYTLDYNGIIPILTLAVQKLRKEVDELKSAKAD